MGLCLSKTPRGGGGGGGTSSPSPSSPRWVDLPPEIASVVLSRLAAHHDRLSFAGVCHEWRLAGQHHGKLLPPAMPCINLGGGAYQSIADGKVCRFATPSDGRVDASFGGWVLYQDEVSARCYLGDPLSPSRPAIHVPCCYGEKLAHRRRSDVLGQCDPLGRVIPVEKILMASPHLVVMMFQGSPVMAAPCNIASFRPGRPTEISWSPPADTSRLDRAPQEYTYKDIAFHLGKIFAVDQKGALLAHELVVGETTTVVSLGGCKQVIRAHLDAADALTTSYHLVTSSDNRKLLMVRWSIPNLLTGVKIDHDSMSLHVFEADLDKGRWSELTDLGSQVLFVSTTGSRAIAVPSSFQQYHQVFLGGNRVFLVGDNWAWAWAWAHRRAIFAHCSCSDCRRLKNGVPNYCV